MNETQFKRMHGVVGLVCPNEACSSIYTRVVDSRPATNGVYRRRQCVACHQRFKTLERITAGALPIKRGNYK